ncbi:hypothetical protein AGR7A_pAt20089 [Agrobacterium deltaense NCPPB 1641]|uniref:Uncharacterized protein n=1 Tax=Agrobacterium deltaense NCPPB 1641 TaxID=1183425 RepID=A0A1S7U8B2_9HYPH|nr:hypothetical protein AGR7A_pAt20089 [Agrobacterium deltaense NCPPB 1641]
MFVRIFVRTTRCALKPPPQYHHMWVPLWGYFMLEGAGAFCHPRQVGAYLASARLPAWI